MPNRFGPSSRCSGGSFCCGGPPDCSRDVCTGDVPESMSVTIPDCFGNLANPTPPYPCGTGCRYDCPTSCDACINVSGDYVLDLETSAAGYHRWTYPANLEWEEDIGCSPIPMHAWQIPPPYPCLRPSYPADCPYPGYPGLDGEWRYDIRVWFMLYCTQGTYRAHLSVDFTRWAIDHAYMSEWVNCDGGGSDWIIESDNPWDCSATAWGYADEFRTNTLLPCSVESCLPTVAGGA